MYEESVTVIMCCFDYGATKVNYCDEEPVRKTDGEATVKKLKNG